MEKRKRQRSKQRLVCELLIDGNRYPSIVRDLSETGLFVQTRATPKPDTVLEVIFPVQGTSSAEVRIEAGVARQRSIPARLQHAVPAGVGLEVLDPPPAFLALVENQRVDPEADGATAVASQPLRTFRIRLTQVGTPGSKIVTVRCENISGARARALTRAGRGWKIAAIQET